MTHLLPPVEQLLLGVERQWEQSSHTAVILDQGRVRQSVMHQHYLGNQHPFHLIFAQQLLPLQSLLLHHLLHPHHLLHHHLLLHHLHHLHPPHHLHQQDQHHVNKRIRSQC